MAYNIDLACKTYIFIRKNVSYMKSQPENRQFTVVSLPVYRSLLVRRDVYVSYRKKTACLRLTICVHGIMLGFEFPERMD